MTVLFVTCLLTVPLSSSASALKPDYEDDGINRKIYYFCDSDPIIKLFPHSTTISGIESESDYCYDLQWDADVNDFRDDYFCGLSYDLVVLEYKRQCPDNDNLYGIISMLLESNCNVLLIVAEGYLNYTISSNLVYLIDDTNFSYYACQQDEIQGYIQRSVVKMSQCGTTTDATTIIDGRFFGWSNASDVITDLEYLYNNNWFWRQFSDMALNNNILVHIPGTFNFYGITEIVSYVYNLTPETDSNSNEPPSIKNLLLSEFSMYENCRFAAFTYILMDTNFNTFLQGMQLQSNATNAPDASQYVPIDVFALVRDPFSDDSDGVEIHADYYGNDSYSQIVHDKDIVAPIMNNLWSRIYS